MSLVTTQFSPAKDGFQFVNRFELRLPVKYTLPIFGTIDLSQVVFGLCGGMCFSSLDYFYGGESHPDYSRVEDIDKKLFVYLCERQLDSLRLPILIKVLEWMMIEDKVMATRMARVEIPKLRKSLDKGQPVVLALIRVQGMGDPTQNHQVLATGYSFDPDTKSMTINLYDPNYPRKEPTLTLNLAKPSAGLQLKSSTGEANRGFFVIPYRQKKAIPKAITRPFTLAGEEAGLVEGIRLQWPVDSRRVNQYFGENPESYKPFGLPGHEGLDLFALSGANIYAAAEGEVYEVGHPKEHPYGLQVRIRHEAPGKVYKTIYAHLSEVFVKVGQRVQSGERIGLADNTGNSFGSHLHLTLKIEGVKTSKYPTGIVDPWPYLQIHEMPPPAGPLPEPSGLTVYTTNEVNLRSQPNTESQILTKLPSGEAIAVLGEAGEVTPKIGAQGQWLQVQTASGLAGFVAAWFVHDQRQAFPPSDLVLYPYDLTNLRSGPGTGFSLLASMTHKDPLTVLGDADVALEKLGRQGEWIQVQTENGLHGFVAAWLVHKTGQVAPASGLVVFPTDLLSVRAQPSTEANTLTVVTPGEALVVLGDQEQARSKIGQKDQWLNIRTTRGFAGYVAAWFVAEKGAAPPPPAVPAQLQVYPTADVNLRAQPSLNSPRVSGAFRNQALQVIEMDQEAARAKVGQNGAWVYVQNKDGHRGWVACWFLSPNPA